jgi:LmeA-like phospholipid-binding
MKALTGALVVVVLLAAGLALADRVAERTASNLIAEQLASDLHLAQTPDVDITGFPFLTQVASGHYQQIDISIPSVTALSVTVRGLDATIRDVHTKPFPTGPADLRSAGAGTVDVGGLVPFSSIPLPPGFTARDADEQLEVSGTIPLFGASIPVAAIEDITVEGSTVTFRPTHIQAQAGGLEVDVSGALARRLTASVDLSGLPFHIEVTGLAVVPSGLQVDGGAQNVSFAGA